MPDSTAARAFQLRHLQLARALFAAIAAVMITFSADHSAAVGLAVFSGFAVATALVLLLSAWLVYPKGRRAVVIVVGLLTAIAGVVSGAPALRTTEAFFLIVVSWAVVTGLIEGIAGLRALRRAPRGSAERSEARDALTVGVVGLVLAVGMLLVPMQYALPYYIADADQTFTLTGITIAVGLFGAYAAIVAVYLAIAAFSPRREQVAPEVRS